MSSKPIEIAIDFGLSNIKVAWRDHHQKIWWLTVPQRGNVDVAELQKTIFAANVNLSDVSSIRVTGGRANGLPDAIDGLPVVKVNEMQAVGRGGLHLAQLSEALIVSAGSGTAMIAAHQHGDETKHVTGSAVGGGTLQGLARLLIGTVNPREINALAEQGDSNRVDLTLIEATGGAIGELPADANAVNFGKLAHAGFDGHASRENLAAGLVCLVGQVIAVIAINAALAEKLDRIVVVGHLVDMPSVCKVLKTVAGYYGADIRIAPNPGYGTVLGALLHK